MQAAECSQSSHTVSPHNEHDIVVISVPLDILTGKGQTQVQACRALEPYGNDLRDNAQRNGMLLSQGSADS